MKKSIEMIAGLESIFQRPLTDEEKVDVTIWAKSQQLDHFIKGFPDEWDVVKEMLETARQDVISQWMSLLTVHPDGVDVAKAHAVAYGSYQAYTNILQGAEGTSYRAEQVPEAIKEGLRMMQAAPR